MSPIATTPPSPTPPALSLRLLGPMALHDGPDAIDLPRSRKCRALLAYLAMSGRPHRRERLCELLWDVADDPRGALRWTLSRLRSVLPKGRDPLRSTRESIELPQGSLQVDALQLSALQGVDLDGLSLEELTAAAGLYDGEFLEGLELTDFLDFSAWCVGQREALRRVHCAVLGALCRRLSASPMQALPWARRRVQVDAFDVEAHRELLSLLLTAGFTGEARSRYQHAVRQFRQVGAPEAEPLQRAWAALRLQARPAATPPPPPPARPEAAAPKRAPSTAGATPFVGRRDVVQRLGEVLAAAGAHGSREAVLISAEPGGGKSRLLERARSIAQDAGLHVLSARAFDLERGRPFGPWIDALGCAGSDLHEPAQSGGRPEVFARLGTMVRDAAAGAGLALLLDDVQWLDRDSAEMLHHLMHTYRGGALVALLAARTGELPDNPAVGDVLRSLQRERVLLELPLSPLSRQEIAALVGAQDEADLEALMHASAGNPLYALELSRGRKDDGPGATPTLVQLLRERLSHLSDAALDALRWAAVLGYTFDAAQLEALSELSQLELVDALEELERHALLRIDLTRSQGRYTFSHDVVREAAYGELSHPRRRLMHRKVANLLRARVDDPSAAYDVARHASLAGEVQLGVQACTAAARYALRTCANADAEALARRGLHHVAQLDEAERVPATLDLLQVLYSARAPNRAEAAEQVRTLAERALDLGLTRAARIGFQMLSYMRWESSSMADAHDNILQAERVSRSADPDERSQALAHAARCLVLLERNLGQAEAFMLEARGVAQRGGRSHAAVAFALGMIAAHRGETDVARSAFTEAQDLARAAGERLAEFGALEHRLMLAVDAGGEDPLPLSRRLLELASKVRPGAEVAIAQALSALCRWRLDREAVAELEAAIEALQQADAKYELAFVLTRRAVNALDAGDPDGAGRIADRAQPVADAIGRVSERVLAACVSGEVAQLRGDAEGLAACEARLEGVAQADLSAAARARLGRLRVVRGT